MRKLFNLCYLLLLPLFTAAQTGASCQTAWPITPAANYCSNYEQYNNVNPAGANLTWFSFIATAKLLNIAVSGSGVTTGGTLIAPTIKLYGDCNTALLLAINSNTGNIATLHAEDLVIGNTYHIAVGGQNTGTFKFCLNNYNAAPTDGEDCETAIYVDKPNDIHMNGFLGAGLKPHESIGTCLDGHEGGTNWFKWKATNNGKLAFTLTPDANNDIDFVLYDLGLSGDCSGVTAANAIRCASGSGIDCTPAYKSTGLSFTATDEREESGCVAGQDGYVKSVDQISGHNYGLLVSNYSGNLGFSLIFKDQNGNASMATFDSADPIIAVQEPLCASTKTYVFSNFLTKSNAFQWDFGPGATIINIDADFNFTVQFAAAGTKNVKLTIFNSLGGFKSTTLPVVVPDVASPLQPAIAANKTTPYCVGDEIKLSTTAQPGLTYQWLNGSAVITTGATISIPVTATYTPVTYSLIAVDGNCKSPAATFTPPLGLMPKAAFTASPNFTTEIIIPATATFTNQSANADSYLWNFGDGSTSTDVNPVHIYTQHGTYHVTLTATSSTNCNVSVTQGDYIINFGNVFFLPNAFTPNGDGINDTFALSITNLMAYHIQIYNRNGMRVFESRDALQRWDGNYHNTPVPFGTYYYLIDATGLDENTIKQSGYVSVIR